MSWFLLIIISVVLSSLTSILQRVMLKKDNSDPVAYSVFFQISISIMLLIFGVLIKDVKFTSLSKLLPNLLLLAVLYGLGNVGIFTALKLTEASKFTILFSSRALFSAIGFTLILGDTFGLKQLIGTILIILGILAVNYGEFSWKFKRGDLYALLAGLCFGLANINDKVLLGSISLYTYLFLAFFIPPLFVLLIKPNIVKKLRSVFNKDTIKVMLGTVLLYGVGAITFFSSLKSSPSPSKVTTVNLTSVILTVVLAIILLKERNKTPQKVIGAILSVVGLYLIV